MRFREEEARAWTDAALARAGRKRVGPLEWVHVRPWSVVLRVPADRGEEVYLKLTAPSLAHEAAITECLYALRPDWILPVLGADPRRGWLLVEAGGEKLRHVLRAEGHARRWEIILPAYASVQQDFIERAGELLELGAPDRRLGALPDAYTRLLARDDVLRVGRPEGLKAAEMRRLEALAPEVARACARLAGFGIPHTIDHGDLHDANVFVRDGRHYFLDWGDASLTHPFFSLRLVQVSLEHTLGWEEGSPEIEGLIGRYLQEWEAYGTPERLWAALRLSERLAPLVSALRWLPAIASLETLDGYEHARTVPALLRELMAHYEQTR